ncbi:alkaline phosphatase family protein [Thermocatellispora tengchongensis]|uniref:sulfatase n=1 Tax=Thermocatellispora tengchongensis TaxID=1073253 RepID=UPI003386E27E
MFTRTRQVPATEDEAKEERRSGWKRRAGAVAACLVLLFALLAPNRATLFTPAAFLRVPVEALIGVALVIVLPPRGRRIAAVAGGAVLGLLTVLKLLDMGFHTVLARPFDPVLDWYFVGAGIEFLTTSLGRVGAWAVVGGVVLLALAVLAATAWAALRLTGSVVRRRGTAAGGLAVLTAVWVACALLGAEIVPGVPVAGLAYERTLQVGESLHDREEFAAQVAVDAFRNTPGERLLTGLRGKDVVLVFVESYGRDAVEDPRFAPQVGAVLDAGGARLRAAGYTARSAFLTSPTVGGGSWLAHATLLSGLWVDNQQRYDALVTTDRLTLNGAFRRASWRTVGVMPGITRAWPEGAFFGYDRVYAARDLGYRGPGFNWGTMPDQYTLSAFQRAERAAGAGPVMAEIPLVSSHAPWAPIPRMVGWDDVGDGSVFGSMRAAGRSPDDVWRDPGKVRTEYRRSIEYSLTSVLSYVERYGGEDLVLVFLGDHQPAPLVTGEDVNRDVPITIVARDPAVLERISGWGWQDGLRPGPKAPVWRMDAFRDRFLTAFSSPSP